MASFSAAYPLRLVERMASGALAASTGLVESIPASFKFRSLAEVGETEHNCFPDLHAETPFPDRPWYENPEWHQELCQCLQFEETFKYKFKRAGHINVIQ